MPVVRKLSPAEAETLEYKPKGQRKLVEEQYDRFFADYDVGDYGEAVLEEDENRLTVRNRFKAAAVRRGLSLEFRRTSDNLLRFKVISGNGQADEQPEPVAAETPVASDTPLTTKRRGGRRKKQEA